MLLKPWTPDRGIQGQAKNGLKIAGVTNLKKPPSPSPVEGEGKVQEREIFFSYLDS